MNRTVDPKTLLLWMPYLTNLPTLSNNAKSSPEYSASVLLNIWLYDLDDYHFPKVLRL